MPLSPFRGLPGAFSRTGSQLAQRCPQFVSAFSLADVALAARCRFEVRRFAVVYHGTPEGRRRWGEASNLRASLSLLRRLARRAPLDDLFRAGRDHAETHGQGCDSLRVSQLGL